MSLTRRGFAQTVGLGTAGMLSSSFIIGRGLEAAEFDVLRGEVAEIGKHLRNLDARLDFTEQLIGGALPLAPPPARLPEPIPGEPVEDSETP